MRCSLLISSIVFTLTACAHTPSPQASLPTYLDQFIGQSSENLQQNLNLQQFGFQSSKNPYSKSNQHLTYKIDRPMTIPIPTFTGGLGGGSGTAPIVQHGSLTNTYNLDMPCYIVFQLENNVIRQWSYKGKAC